MAVNVTVSYERKGAKLCSDDARHPLCTTRVISCYHYLTNGEFCGYSTTLRDGLVYLTVAYLHAEIWFQQVQLSA